MPRSVPQEAYLDRVDTVATECPEGPAIEAYRRGRPMMRTVLGAANREWIHPYRLSEVNRIYTAWGHCD